MMTKLSRMRFVRGSWICTGQQLVHMRATSLAERKGMHPAPRPRRAVVHAIKYFSWRVEVAGLELETVPLLNSAWMT
jgi:putative SOS response-associated peptidase YedK